MRAAAYKFYYKVIEREVGVFSVLRAVGRFVIA